MLHSEDPDYIEVRIGDDGFVYGCSECTKHFRIKDDKIEHEIEEHNKTPIYNLDICDFDGRRDDA